MQEFGSLAPQIVDFIRANGIKKPTAIQRKAIEKIRMSREDFLLLAPTGSGKTEAALLPLLDKLVRLKQETHRDLFGFYILYITPLRALNRDVFKRVRELCLHLDISVAVRHGDTTQHFRRKQAIDPPNLLITTPESLQAILPGKRLRYHLKTVFAVVVDEVHELANSKRGTQLSLGLERLEHLIGRPLQRVGLSATVGNPTSVASLLGGGHTRVNTIWAGYRSREMTLRVEMPVPREEHYVIGRRISYPPHSTARLERIIELIDSHTTTIVFTNTRSFAEMLGSKMRIRGTDYLFEVHHGSLSRDIRMTAEDRLKKGDSKAIIATSSLELGIDIGQADLVIQYSSAREVRRALQRTGRAGHGVGKVAEGVFLATMNLDDIIESGVILRRARANRVENASIPNRCWDVLCHQIAGILLDLHETTYDDLLALIRRAFPFRDLQLSDLQRLAEFLAERAILANINSKLRISSRTRSFYYKNLSTIPDVRQIHAVDMTSHTSIGVLDEDFVSGYVSTGSVFVIRGRPYSVVNIEDDEILCAPVSGIDTEAPKWVGEMIPVPYEVAMEVSDVWKRVNENDSGYVETWLKNQYGIAKEAKDFVFETVKRTAKQLGMIPSRSCIIIENFGSGIVVHLPFGTKTNEGLGIVIAALLTTRSGIDVAVERDPYRILLTSSEPIDPSFVANIFREYDEEQVSIILRMALKNTQTFASRFIHVARRMDVIKKDAKVKEIPIKYLIRIFEGTPVFEETMKEVLHEKVDEKRILDIFKEVKNKNVQIHQISVDTPSDLARLIVEEKTRFEVMGEITEEDEILRLMEKRLLSTKIRLICIKGHWNSVRTISTLDEKVSCPICKSTVVIAVHSSKKDIADVMKKKSLEKRLTKAEEKAYRRAMLSATLVSEYGKKALIVLAGRGIGPDTASRILSPSLNNRLELLREIAKAERLYARTRQFWDL